MSAKKRLDGMILFSAAAFLSFTAGSVSPAHASTAEKTGKPAEMQAQPFEETQPGIISRTEAGIKTALALNGILGTEISSGTAKDCFELETLITRLAADSAAAAGKTAKPGPGASAAFDGSNRTGYKSILEKALKSLGNFKLDKKTFSDENRTKIFKAAEVLYEKMGESTLDNMDRQIAEDELRAQEESKKAGEMLNEADCKLHIAELMTALSDYKEKNGKCPEKLSLLVPGYINEIPAITLPGHATTGAVTVIAGDFKAGISSAVKDTGGWLYFSNPQSAYYCRITPDCSHNDTDGAPFFKAGVR